MDAPTEAAMPRGDASTTPPHWSVRVARALAIVVIVVSPLVLSIRAGGQAWFTWRMFSTVNAEVTYEGLTGDGWREVELDDLSWWDRGAHVGTANLRALCDGDPDLEAVRRLLDGDVDEELTCG